MSAEQLLQQVLEGQRVQAQQMGAVMAEVSGMSHRLELLEQRTGSLSEVTGRHELVTTIAEKGAARRGQFLMVIASALVGAIATAGIAALFAVGASHLAWR